MRIPWKSKDSCNFFGNKKPGSRYNFYINFLFTWLNYRNKTWFQTIEINNYELTYKLVIYFIFFKNNINNFSSQAFEELEVLLAKYSICIAIKEKLVKDSGVAEDTAYDEIVLKLLTKPRARGKLKLFLKSVFWNNPILGTHQYAGFNFRSKAWWAAQLKQHYIYVHLEVSG